MCLRFFVSISADFGEFSTFLSHGGDTRWNRLKCGETQRNEYTRLQVSLFQCFSRYSLEYFHNPIQTLIWHPVVWTSCAKTDLTSFHTHIDIPLQVYTPPTAADDTAKYNSLAFKPHHYNGFTFFKSYYYSSPKLPLYLGCDEEGKTTLVTSLYPTTYPNPQTLFIANRVG